MSKIDWGTMFWALGLLIGFILAIVGVSLLLDFPTWLRMFLCFCGGFFLTPYLLTLLKERKNERQDN